MTSEQGRNRTQAAREASLWVRRLRRQRRLADELTQAGWVCLRDARLVEATGYSDHVMYLVRQDIR